MQRVCKEYYYLIKRDIEPSLLGNKCHRDNADIEESDASVSARARVSASRHGRWRAINTKFKLILGRIFVNLLSFEASSTFETLLAPHPSAI